MPVSYFDVGHELHPHSRGQRACESWAWIELIAMARWRDEGGLRRGELRVAQSYLATRWHWSRSRVQRFLEDLEKAGEIRRGHGTGREPDRIVICQYDRYQKPRTASGSANGSANGSQVYKEYNHSHSIWAEAWDEIVGLVERPLASLQPSDIKALPAAARDALHQLGGVPALKAMNSYEFARASKRFPGLCREASQGGGQGGRSDREPPRRDGNGISRPEVDVATLQVVS